jgi:hypothetical protein
MARKIKCRLEKYQQEAARNFILAQLQGYRNGEVSSNAMIRLAQDEQLIRTWIGQRDRYVICQQACRQMLARLHLHFTMPTVAEIDQMIKGA